MPGELRWPVVGTPRRTRGSGPREKRKENREEKKPRGGGVGQRRKKGSGRKEKEGRKEEKRIKEEKKEGKRRES